MLVLSSLLVACGYPRLPDLEDASSAGPVCGDGVQQADEICDDGNTLDGDACNATCSAATCLVPVTHPTVAAVLADPQCGTAYLYSGTYAETITISKTVTLVGVGSAPAILDGRGLGSVVSVMSGVVVLQGFTVSNGHADKGAGVINHAALTLRDMRVSGNTAIASTGQGGGVYNDGNFLTLTNTTITGNHATTDASGATPGAAGAGLFVAGGAVTATGGSIDTNDLRITGLGGAIVTGAGIALAGGSLTTSGTSITSNVIDLEGHPGDGSASGAGIYVASGASLALSDGAVSNNSLRVHGVNAAGAGAGMFRDGNVMAAGTRFDNNSLDVVGDSNASAQGGGISVANATVVSLSKVTLNGNQINVVCNTPQGNGRAAGFGGGFMSAAQLANIFIDSSSMANNTVTASGGLTSGVDTSLASGGGIYWNPAFKAGSLTIQQTTVAGNTTHASLAFGAGVEVSCFHGMYTLALSQSTVSGNQAVGALESFGAGIYSEASVDTTTSESMVISMSNSTLSGNLAQTSNGSAQGGGFALAMGGAFFGDVGIDIASSTITANTAQGSTGSVGGGLLLSASGGTTTTRIRNTILSGNIGATPECSAAAISGGASSVVSQGFNVFGDTTGCTIAAASGDVSSSNAMLGPLADNGGATSTRALLPGSPATDAGNPVGCMDRFGNPLAQDQRGMPRISNGRCDIGAYEK